MRKRTLHCIRIAFKRKRYKYQRKGGAYRFAWSSGKFTYTLTEGPCKPEFTFLGTDAVPGESFRAITSDWCKHDIFACPTYERLPS